MWFVEQKNLVGPFSGKSELDSVYGAVTQEKVEGENNNYRIYRKLDVALKQIKNGSDQLNLDAMKKILPVDGIFTRWVI